MSKPHMATAEAQHEGSKEMQCTSKNYSVQTPNIDSNCFKTVIREKGPRKLFKMMSQQLGLGQPDGRPSSCPNLIWPQPRPDMKDQRRCNAPLKTTQSRPPT